MVKTFSKKEHKSKKKKLETVVIKVENLSKTFRVPHEKHTSLKATALNVFHKKTYEEFSALKKVSFEVKKGEFFGIIGRNGCGKSTLLKILAGIYTPDNGNIEVNGKLSPFLELGVGFNPELTARENVFLGGAILGLTRKQINKKFKDIIEFSELEEFVDMKFKNFSSGMQVRLAFSLAIHAHAEILLMDEVLAVGDNNFQKKCFDIFREFKKQGKTIIFVSHGMNSVEEFCDRVLYLEKGKTKGIGETIEIVNKYNLDNISYQESKIIKEKTNKDNKKIQKRTAAIKNIRFLDKYFEEKKIFMTGEKLIIRVNFQFMKEVEFPLIGIAIYKDRDKIIYGTNNEKRNVVIEKIRPQTGFIDFEIEKLSLLEGSYQVSVAIARKKSGLIDQQDRKYSFMVNNGNLRDYGIYNIKPKVKIELKK